MTHRTLRHRHETRYWLCLPSEINNLSMSTNLNIADNYLIKFLNGTHFATFYFTHSGLVCALQKDLPQHQQLQALSQIPASVMLALLRREILYPKNSLQ